MQVPGATDDLRAIHAEFAMAVTYYGAGLHGRPVAAVESDANADGFMGSAGGLRSTSFEIMQSDLPGEAEKGDRIVDAEGTSWRVIEPQRRNDLAAWVLIVEEGA